MTFESEKTGQYLRAKVLKEGAEERMRALQALSHGYGAGSHAALAKMLLATLGGQNEDTVLALESQAAEPQAAVTQVAQVMQNCANDSYYEVKEATSSS